MLRLFTKMAPWIFFVMFFFLFLSQTTFGATNVFPIQTQVGTDITPPTIPTTFTATPIAATQIDLSWGASTDDFLLSGYHVWRDSVQIATTSSLSYSDTGLTASTTYTYYVTAFDAVFNESASSTEVATTTLETPPPTPTPTTTPRSGTVYGSRARPLADEIIVLEVFPEKESVTIHYVTKNHIRGVTRWGKSTSYELGSLAEEAYNTNHVTRITGLRPGTTYSFTLEGENKIGRYGALHMGTFTTQSSEDVFPPGNVSNLTAIRSGDDILLSWINPGDSDLAKVRVMRNEQFFPSDTADGWVVYEGLGNSVRDPGMVTGVGRQYYTVFTYDALGNVSSGAVVSVYVGEPQHTSGTSTVPEEFVPTPELNPISLVLDDVFFMQEGERIYDIDGKIRIDGSKQLTITIPYDRVPEHLKTILVTVHDNKDGKTSFSFLLRITKDMTGYTGVIAPMGISGTFPTQISVFDFKTSQIGYVDSTILSYVVAPSIDARDDGTVHPIMAVLGSVIHSYVSWLVLLMILLMIMVRKLMQTQF